jgi:hypothetical protein
MKFMQKLRQLFVCTALLAGLMGGSPMSPDDIERLLYANSRQKQEQTVKQDED